MKKLIFSFLIFLFLPLISYAEVDYDITDFYVNARILDNGDLEVNELIVLDGEFSGYERDLVYRNPNLTGNDYENNVLYNASNISDVVIKAKYVDKVSFDTFKENDFDDFLEVGVANNGEKSKYIKSNLNNGYRYRMYYPASDEAVAFNIKYIVKDVAVLHNDVAEVYWTFIPSGFEDELENIKIRVYLPNSDTTDNFRIWAHGNLAGEVKKMDNTGVYASIDKVMPGEAVDIRTTFDKSLITDTSRVKVNNDDALDKIIEVEKVRAGEANKLREKLLKQYNFIKYGTNIMFGVIILLGIFIYFKYGKSPKSGYFSKYNREFIDEYNVEVIDYLMNRKITPNALTASIMNLIYKKNIKAEEIVGDGKSKKKDYQFTLVNRDNLVGAEDVLVDFLFNKVGKDNMFTTKDLKNYAKGTKTCEVFINSYTKWKKLVESDGEKQGFFESSGVPKIFGLIVLIISLCLFVRALGLEVDYLPTYLLFPVAIIFFIVTLTMYRKTKRGSLHYDKWKAFKNFLDDFGAFELKELPEIVLWERYLVYACIFGLADKVQKSMNVKISEIDTTSLDYDYFPTFFYLSIGDSINTSVNSAINSAYSSQAANYANSHSSSSSGSGFGGGFSSGGGFGGGGGGGRGF